MSQAQTETSESIERIPPPEPGLHPGIPFKEYLRWDAADFSTLKVGKIAWALARHRMLYPPPDKAHLGFGRLYHCLTLEPDHWEDQFVLVPETYPARGGEMKPWSGNATYCREWKAEQLAAGLSPVRRVGTEQSPGFDQAQEMAEKARDDERVGTFIRAGIAEVSAVAQCPRTGELVKCRFDTWIPDFCMAIDLKSTTCAHEDRWWPEAYRLKYHLQSAIYIDVMRWLGLDKAATDANVPWFCFLAQDKYPPFLPKSYDVQDDEGAQSFDFLAKGRREYHILLAQYAECRKTGVWPGYNTANSDMILPYHAADQLARERNENLTPGEESAWPTQT